MANGGDNIGIYTPSFAIRSASEIAVIALIFVVMSALWCFLAHAMVNHPKLGLPIRRYGHRLAPVLLIGLGVLILYQAGSFELVAPESLSVGTVIQHIGLKASIYT